MQMEEFMTRRYELRFNRMKGCKEYRERHSLFTDYRPVTAEAVKSICFEAQLEGISAIEYDVQRYVDSRRVSHYWPIEEFLFDLPHWDGQDRIRALADCVPCENKEWRDFFYIWFLSMVAHWLQMDRNMPIARHPCWSGRRLPQEFFLPESSAARIATLLCRWDRLGKPEGCGDGVEPFRADQPG